MKRCPQAIPLWLSAYFAVFLLLFPPTAGIASSRQTAGEAEAGWRTDWTGLYDRALPPLTWSAKENVRWKIPLQRWSNATPVLWKNLVCFCEEPSTVLCADTDKAAILWKAVVNYEEFVDQSELRAAGKAQARMREMQKERNLISQRVNSLNVQVRTSGKKEELLKPLREAQQELNRFNVELRKLQIKLKSGSKPPTHATNGYSSPTPVIGGGRLYVLFGYGAAAAFDLEGNRIWARMVERSTNGWGHSASPMLTDGKLILHINRSVYALDPDSGEELWKAASSSTWGTPLPLRIGTKRAVLTTGGDIIRCRDGKVVASQVGVMPWTSPIEHAGVIYIVDQNGAFPFRAPDKLEDTTPISKLWQSSPARDRYYASPVVHEGILYAVTQRGILSAIDILDGSVIYEKKLGLGGTFYPSLAVAGGRIYVSSDTGKTIVLEPGRAYTEVAKNSLEPFRSTPVFSGAMIYIRGLKNLYCIGGE